MLSPLILAHFSHLAAEWSPVAEADITCVGSLLEHIPPGWAGHIAGSGRLTEDTPLTLSSAHIHAVRGPLSARGLSSSIALGDPGLLADEMVSIETRDIRLGIVPHWSDTELAHNWTFARYDPVVISAFGDPLETVRTIGRCQKIVASSLHGIVLADAFGIPRRTEVARRFRDNPHEGSMLKFRDYNLSVGVPFATGEVQQPRRGTVETRKHEIWDVLRALPKAFL